MDSLGPEIDWWARNRQPDPDRLRRMVGQRGSVLRPKAETRLDRQDQDVGQQNATAGD